MAAGPVAEPSKYPAGKPPVQGRAARVLHLAARPRGDSTVDTYPVEVDPAQLVRWLRIEHDATPNAFRVTARRATEVEELPVREELHLGDAEREDLAEVATLATLDIEPANAAEGWQLTVVVEDEIGPRFLGAGAQDQQIDLGTFYGEFVRPERGSMTVSARVADAAAGARLARLLQDVETNRHAAGAARRGK
jgi:hypothetical protein